jgi:hypothetical protein
MIRYEFIDSSIQDYNIHPDMVFTREQELAKTFVDKLITHDIVEACPICGSHRNEILFGKWGFKYAICPESWSIALAAMPPIDILKDYLFNSALSKFRASKEYQQIVNEKRVDLWEGQRAWIKGRINRYLGHNKYNVVDWGSKSTGWIESMRKEDFIKDLSIMEPLPPISMTEGLNKKADLILMIDVLQREVLPYRLLERVSDKIKKDGLLFITCRAGSGYDVLSLLDRSESIFPLDHIILPSPEGMKYLMENAGFEVLEITTPGLLDLKYIEKSSDNIPKDQYFLRYILKRNNKDLLDRMQAFLQRNNLSSHLRCVARKI